MKKRYIMTLCLMILAAFLLAGCKKDVGTPEDNAQPKVEDEEEKEETYVFGFSGITMDNPYYITLESAIRERVEDEGCKLITKNPGLDSEKQIEQIDEMIAEGIQAIFLAPIDWEKIEPALERLKDAKVKIINLDTEAKDYKLVDAYIGSDNKHAGAICGEKLIEAFPEGGRVIILECPTMNSINDRITGFETKISEKGFEIVGREDVQGDLNNAIVQAKKLLSEHEDITAIMCGNDQIALGALVAAQSMNRTELKIYSVDGSPDLKKELVKANTLIAGTSAQSPIQIAKDAVEVAFLIMKGEVYEKTTYEEVFFIDKDNVDIYGVDGWQ